MNVLVWGPVLAWMAVIFVLSSQPSLPSAPEALLDLVIKKGGHFVEFAILAVLCFRAFVKAGADWVAKRPWLWSLVVSIGYAGLDEVHQSFTPNRHPQVSDVLVDGAGIVLALVAIVWSRQQHDVVE